MISFDKYSRYYDLLYNDKNYKIESDYILKLISDNNPPKTLLELGCGSGGHAKYFSQKKIHVTGLDISKTMIDIAKSKKIDYFEPIVSEITNFSLNKKFDSIVSLFHVISYLNENEQIENCFKNVYDHLNDNGAFIFDFWYTPNVKYLKPEIRIRRKENSELSIVRISEPEIIEDLNIVKVNFDIYIKDKNSKEILNIKEEHSMRHFDIKELINIAQNIGFKFEFAEEFLTRKKPSKISNGILIKFIK